MMRLAFASLALPVQQPGLRRRGAGTGFWLPVLLVALYAPAAGAQSFDPEAGLFLSRTYTHEDHTGSPQNWAVNEDTTGMVYVGNGAGVLEFDGLSWRLVSTPGRTLVRALAQGADGRIYVGARSDFGYLAPDSTGTMRFVSLLDTIDGPYEAFGDVDAAVRVGDEVFFQTDGAIFVWDGARTRVLRGQFFLVHEVDGHVYTFVSGRGLFRIEGEALHLVPGTEGLDTVERELCVLLRLDDGSMLVGTRRDGLFRLRDGRLTPLPTPVDDLLRSRTVYRGTMLPGGAFAVGTRGAGVFFFDPEGRLRSHIDERDGLASNVVNDLFVAGDGGLWVATDLGITRVAIAAGLTHFDERLGLRGKPEVIQRHHGTLYVGTLEGLFVLHPRPEAGAGAKARFEEVPGVQGGVWALVSFDDVLLIGADAIFQLEAGRGEAVRASDGSWTYSPYDLLRSRVDRDRVYVAHTVGLAAIRREGRRWAREGVLLDLKANVRSILERADGSLLVTTDADGILYLDAPQDGGLPGPATRMASTRDAFTGRDFDGRYYSFLDLDGTAYLAYGNARDVVRWPLHRFDPARRQFVPDTTFGAPFADPRRRVFRMAAAPSGDVWLHATFSTEPSPGVALRQPDGTYRWDGARLSIMPPGTTFDILPEADGKVWYAHLGGVFLHDPAALVRQDRPFHAFIRQVTSTDSLVYGGAGAAPEDRGFRAGKDELRFAFAALSFDDPERTHFQVRLDGLNDDWSGWSESAVKEYAGLSAGSYRFRVRAMDVYGRVSEEAAFDFRILPPWYQTGWAYALYGLGLLGMIVPAVRYVSTRRLRRQVRALETERRLHEERERISRDLHDNVGAQLSNIISGIELIRLSTTAGKLHLASEHLGNLDTDAHETMRQLRETIWALHQNHVSIAAFRDQVQQFLAVQTRYRERPVPHLSVEGDAAVVLSPVQALNLYRIVQEAIHNALKYACAENLYVVLRASPDAVELIVRDDGTFRERGAGEGERHYGLEGMRRRAAELGGTFDLRVDGGTTVSVRVALRERSGIPSPHAAGQRL